jgi:hypothetical protein
MLKTTSTRNLILLTSLLSGSFVIMVAGQRSHWTSWWHASASTTTQDAKGKDERSAIEVQVIRLTHKGFDPKHIKHTTGQFLLVFQNETSQPLPPISLFTKKGLADRAAPGVPRRIH